MNWLTTQDLIAFICCVSFLMTLFFHLLSLTFRGQGSICYKLPCALSDSRNRHLMEANFRSVLPMQTTGQKGCGEGSVVFLPSPSVQHSTSGPSIHPPTAKGWAKIQLRPLLHAWPYFALTTLKCPSLTKHLLTRTMCSFCDIMQNKLSCAYWSSCGIVGKFQWVFSGFSLLMH